MQFAQGQGVAGRIYSALDAASTAQIVGKALAGGVNWFDTAEMYGRGASERAVTQALEASRTAPGEVVMVDCGCGSPRRERQGEPVATGRVWSDSTAAAARHSTSRNHWCPGSFVALASQYRATM
jgi:aryl-alcohol dehydrogenase-like predicted oxidoreductase